MSEFDLEAALDRAERSPGQTPARLLREAETLFARRGFDGVRTRDVAGAAGVNVSTLHFHWRNKGTLYEAVCRAHARLLRSALEHAVDVISPGEPPDRQQIEHWIDQVLSLLIENPAIAPMALQSVSDQTPPELPALFHHDVALFGSIEREVTDRMKSTDGDPMFSILSVFYFVVVAFCDSSLQRTVLGGSLLADAALQDRFKKFSSRLLLSLLDG